MLLVDDDPRVLTAVGRRLGFEGFQVDLVANGQAALDAVAARRPDLVILDVMLPEMDGLEVARSVCSRARGRVVRRAAPRSAAADQ